MMVNDPLTKFMFCSPAEGGVALVLCRADQAAKYTDTPVYLKGATMKSRRYGSFEVFAPSQALRQVEGPTVDASRAAFEMAGVGPKDIDVMQLQDTESGAEIMHMAG
jgi:acetyl-CoA acetyltransferase